MSELIVLDCDGQTADFLYDLAVFAGKNITIFTQMVVQTEDHDVAEAIWSLIKAREKPEAVVPPDEDFTDVLDAPRIEVKLVADPGTEKESEFILEVPDPGPWEKEQDPHGMTAAPVSERDTVCAHCGQHFIRRRKDQTYCMKPDCQKAKARSYVTRRPRKGELS